MMVYRLHHAPPGASGSPSLTVAAPPCRHLPKESLAAVAICLMTSAGEVRRHQQPLIHTFDGQNPAQW